MINEKQGVTAQNSNPDPNTTNNKLRFPTICNLNTDFKHTHMTIKFLDGLNCFHFRVRLWSAQKHQFKYLK